MAVDYAVPAETRENAVKRLETCARISANLLMAERTFPYTDVAPKHGKYVYTIRQPFKRMLMNIIMVAIGHGTNVAALLERMPINTVIVNMPNSLGAIAAKEHGMNVIVAADMKEIHASVEKCKPDLICLTGFTNVPPDDNTQEYNGKDKFLNYIIQKYDVMNINSFPIPCPPHQKCVGCMVYLVGDQINDGKIITQRVAQILSVGTAEHLSTCALEEESEAYITAVKLFMDHVNGTMQYEGITMPKRFSETFGSAHDAITFALERITNMSPWSGMPYMWRNGKSIMVTKEPPDHAPCIVVTPGDFHDDVEDKLQKMIDW